MAICGAQMFQSVGGMCSKSDVGLWRKALSAVKSRYYSIMTEFHGMPDPSHVGGTLRGRDSKRTILSDFVGQL